MSWLQDIIARFGEGFRWFFILQPWEQALRVRAGSRIKKYQGGLHFKIPYLDYIFKQNCRIRISDIPNQTITTLDDHTITVAGALEYRVDDVEPLYMHLHQAENAIAQTVQGILTSHIAWSTLDDCEPEKLMEYVNNKLAFDKWGLADYEFILTDFARVKTYRLITGDLNRYQDFSLQTDEAEDL